MANDNLSTKVYGDIHVGGHAHVQLGDRVITRHNHFHVRGIYVSTREKHELARVASARTRFPQISQRANGTIVRTRRWNGANHLDKRRNQVGGSSSCAPQAYEDVTASTAAWAGVLSQARSASRRFTNALAKRADWKDIRQTILDLYECLVRKQPVGRSPSPHMQKNDLDEHLGYLTNSSTAGGTVTVTSSPQQQVHARRDFLVLCAAVLTLMLGRNISAHDVLEVLSRCQHDQLMPVLTFLLGIGMYRYAAISTIARAPAAQHHLTLEDAYGHQRTVTMDVCMDFGILRKFLEVHYQQTNRKAGEALIRAGRFHLMLGSRRGRVINAQEWAVPGRIRAGSRIINSVYVMLNDTRCLHCQTVFTVTDNGEFHCKPCQVYHRDYDTFRSTAGDKATLPQGREAGERKEEQPHDGSYPLTRSEPMRAEDANPDTDTNYRIDGLRNVNVRIVARQKVRDSPYSRGLSSLRRSKRPSMLATASPTGDSQQLPQYLLDESRAGSIPRQTGTVKWFSDAKGFGFIIPDSGSENIFVHYTSIWATNHRTLLEGERVEFFEVVGQKGVSAEQVIVLSHREKEILRSSYDDPDTSTLDDEFERMIAEMERKQIELESKEVRKEDRNTVNAGSRTTNGDDYVVMPQANSLAESFINTTDNMNVLVRAATTTEGSQGRGIPQDEGVTACQEYTTGQT